tara:strand:- start:98 stop:307 length:210 start_codon:yes stop_codon:yes gene_type:complete
MKSHEKVKPGMIIKNPVSGEVGIIKKIVPAKERNCYVVTVKTRTGRKKWKFKFSEKSFLEKVISLFSLK